MEETILDVKSSRQIPRQFFAGRQVALFGQQLQPRSEPLIIDDAVYVCALLHRWQRNVGVDGEMAHHEFAGQPLLVGAQLDCVPHRARVLVLVVCACDVVVNVVCSLVE